MQDYFPDPHESVTGSYLQSVSSKEQSSTEIKRQPNEHSNSSNEELQVELLDTTHQIQKIEDFRKMYQSKNGKELKKTYDVRRSG